MFPLRGQRYPQHTLDQPGTPRSGHGEETEVPFEPFLGILGVAENTARLPNSVPPEKFGGNLDLHNLTVGSTLYLPVLVPGAQSHISDSHFGQGNGEVSLTAIEGSLRATLRLTLLKQGDPRIPMKTPLLMPFAENADYWIPNRDQRRTGRSHVAAFTRVRSFSRRM